MSPGLRSGQILSEFVKSEAIGNIFTWTLRTSISELRGSLNLILFLQICPFAKVSFGFRSHSTILPYSKRNSILKIRHFHKIIEIHVSGKRSLSLDLFLFNIDFLFNNGGIEPWHQNPNESIANARICRKRIKLKLLLSAENEFFEVHVKISPISSLFTNSYIWAVWLARPQSWTHLLPCYFLVKNNVW